MLILVSGPSGVGKNTIIAELMERHPSLEFMKTCTTRESRAQNDDSYYHVTSQEFKAMIKNNELFEYENVHADIFYGTPFSSLNKVIEGQTDYIKDLDVHGTMKVKEYLKDKAKVVTIFLDSPDHVLRKRLEGRGEKKDMIQKRLSRNAMERTYKDKYDLVLECDEIEKTVTQIEKFCFQK